jgi:serine phosphatase RsbU (regulator of sigma subunit)
MLSDGFQDQFGGEDNKKYLKKKMREFLLKISHLPLQEQKLKVQQELEDWKGDKAQTDDILVVGIKF